MDGGDLLVRALVLIAIVTIATFFAYILIGFTV